MAKNITLMGASYSGVPAVDLPQTGGGTARFMDTSDANATVADIVSGKTAYVNGVKLTGEIPTKTDRDITVSGAEVRVPAGYYDDDSGVIISDGYVNAPTASKSAVSNHSVSITPFVAYEEGYISNGSKYGTAVTVSASELVSGSETKTQNGTYDVTNLAELVVNVSGGGGATNFVTGTFTTPSTTSTNGTVTVPYTGTGYPIALIIFVEGGCYNSAIDGWYNSLTRYAVGQVCITKANTTTAPTYGTSGAANQGTIQLLYKSSSSTATSYSSARLANANSYSSSNANGTSTTSVRWINNTTISYRTAGGTSSTYGLLADTTYRYIAVYSQ